MSAVNSTSREAIFESLNPQRDENTWATEDNDAMGKDTFLKLLVTQMQNQDPLNPTDGTEFTQQLAQFTEVEQLYQLNDKFSSITAALQTQANYQAIYLVGKEVKALNSAIKLTDGQTSEASYTLGEAAAEVYISIYDEEGHFVRKLDLGAKEAGEYDIDWDGRNALGGRMPDGNYAFKITASGKEGEEIPVSPTITGPVTGVTFDANGTPWLLMNGMTVSLNAIIEIKEREANGGGEEEEKEEKEEVDEEETTEA